MTSDDTNTRLSAARPRTFLVVVDDTPEMPVALRYAALRARNTGGRVALLNVMEPEQNQQWMALDELIHDERRAEVEALMERHAAIVRAITGTLPGVHIREGLRYEEVLALITEDPSISILVLAAGLGDSGPGPLISALSGRMNARWRVPITIVPGSLGDDELAALT